MTVRVGQQYGDAKAVNDAGQHVAPLVVRAEPIVFKVAAALEPLAFDDMFALRFGQHPGRRRGRRCRQIEVVGVVGVADRRTRSWFRPSRRSAYAGTDRDSQRRFRSRRRTWFRIGHENRKVPFALIVDEVRPIIGDELGEQRDHEQHQKHPKRNVARSLVGLEVLPAPAIKDGDILSGQVRWDQQSAPGQRS